MFRYAIFKVKTVIDQLQDVSEIIINRRYLSNSRNRLLDLIFFSFRHQTISISQSMRRSTRPKKPITYINLVDDEEVKLENPVKRVKKEFIDDDEVEFIDNLQITPKRKVTKVTPATPQTPNSASIICSSCLAESSKSLLLDATLNETQCRLCFICFKREWDKFKKSEQVLFRYLYLSKELTRFILTGHQCYCTLIRNCV